MQFNLKKKQMVPGEGFEPPTFGLQNRCTTTVLTRLSISYNEIFTSSSFIQTGSRKVS